MTLHKANNVETLSAIRLERLPRNDIKSVVLVLMSFNIILQEDLDLPRHLWPNVFYEEACNHGDASEA